MKKLFGCFIVLVILGVSCASSQTGAPPTEGNPTQASPASPPTDNPLPTAIPQATATPLPTKTTAPTSTATPDSRATLEARTTATAEAAASLIEADLKQYGLSLEDGHLGWFHRPLTIKVDTYGEAKADTDYPKTKAFDFMVQADVTWNTSSGLAGCGFLLRAGPNYERSEQYQIVFLRLQGMPLWGLSYFKEGKFYYNSRVEASGVLSDKQGGTNKIAILAQEDKFTIFANGEKIGTVKDNHLMSPGQVAFMARHESGETECEFSNAWLWIYKDAP